ncbi:MAG: 50S ribosomal protein L29 [Acidimicrobiaceae bacterium]|jgi:large subunit ribosomal protein L29|nr:50S ribosomal protein L29 [Acidimicrobiaceae bacterium]
MAKHAERVSELRELPDHELLERLGESRRELFNLRFQLATGQLENSARLGQVRREIARLSTLVREREISAAEVLVGEGE